jgi:hypothetical protein
MEDKSLSIFLTLLFGVSGMAKIMLEWLWPAPESERILNTISGSTGILAALYRALSLKSWGHQRDTERVLADFDVEDNY